MQLASCSLTQTFRMMHLDTRTVSRKTPRDGKLEISPSAATALERLGGQLRAEWAGEIAAASLTAMQCTCGGEGASHEHHFLESAPFRALPVGAEVELAVDGDVVRVSMTPSR